jgi:myosin heavy subunit
MSGRIVTTKNNIKMEKRQITIYAGAAVLALLLIGLFISLGSNARNKKYLNSERLASEKLLSGKLSVEKELGKLQGEFNSLRQKSDANALLLDETNMKIAESENKINSLTRENRSLRASRNELAELKKFKENLEKESAQLKTDYNRLMSFSKNLQNSIEALEEDKKRLALELENTRKIDPDNFMVTATRGKKTEKIVVRASRAKKLNMIFEVPQSVTEAITFKVVTPSGSVINPDDKAVSWYILENERNFTASLSPVTGEFEKSHQVVFNYASKGKLVRGEYKIQILNNGVNIGNCRIMLR